MDKKILAIIAVVVIVIVAAAAVFVVMSDDDDKDEFDKGAYNIIARANTEGSGLYIDESLLLKDDSGNLVTPLTRASNNVQFFDADYKVTSDNKEAWGGLVFADPGLASIQHTQLAQIAADAGLSFKQFSNTGTSNDTLYYHTGLANYGDITNATDIQGGIIWEPQHQRVIQESGKYVQLALTNDMFSGHTCCVVAANHDWLEDNEDTAAKFLAGYKQAVDFMNQALTAGKTDATNADYVWLVKLATDKTVGLKDPEIKASFDNITYLWGDGDDGNLDKLTKDVSELAANLNNLGLITNKSFTNDKADELADKLVDDDYLEKAVTGDFNKDSKASVRVANINGDIHEIAIHVAIAKDYFSQYNLSVTLNSKSTSGGDVTTLLEAGDTDIGFLGAPPATLKTINGDHIDV